MGAAGLEHVMAEIAAIRAVRAVGRIAAIGRGTLLVTGLSESAALGDLVDFEAGGSRCRGEVLHLAPEGATVLPDGPVDGLQIGTRVVHLGPCTIAPHDGWMGRVVDAFGAPLDGRPLLRGPAPAGPGEATAAMARRGLGRRLETGLAVFNTLLPIVRGQRIGLFAGSGVGKSTLLGKLARGIEADVVVVAMIGERGREVREFVERILGPEGLARSVVVAATSDRSPLARRRCAATAMSVAEHFRDAGRHVLLLADSVTRFAEAHREVALAVGEPPSLRGFPPSTAAEITRLAERAGPGAGDAGDITAIFSVLVAGSDMEEPVADILRGVLDGHVVLDRAIAERGRFPAIDLLRSVSRALPDAANAAENALIAEARRRLGAYDRSEMMIRAGLYAAGSDPEIDAAIAVWPALDRFLAETEHGCTADSFARLAAALAEAQDQTVGKGPS